MRKLFTDRLLLGIVALVFGYIWFFSQGLPLWDDDFTSWFDKIQDKSWLRIVGEWLSPISTQPEHWGFNERPLQALLYKTLYLFFGYDWDAFFFYKNVVYALLAGMVYVWGARLAGPSWQGKTAAAAAAIFFCVLPGPLAAHILYADFATTAELLFLILTYVLWQEVEKTPDSWTAWLDRKKPEQKAWLKRWAILSVCVYLAYKSKADLKLIPVILAIYLALLPKRRRQWRIFLPPVSFMALLAVPWSTSIFSKLPPFVPGSEGSEIGWMWQPASMSRLRHFFWSDAPYQFFEHLTSPTLSLAGVLGPFLLVPILAFFIWSWKHPALKAAAVSSAPAKKSAAKAAAAQGWLDLPQNRALLFILIWTALTFGAVSTLAEINYTFRIRYGILTSLPVCLLLAWVFAAFLRFISALSASYQQANPGKPLSPRLKHLPRWALALGVALFVFQVSANAYRSIRYRYSFGQVMVAVDQAYGHLSEKYPDHKLALLPDFLPYDQRPDAPAVLQEKSYLGMFEDLARNHEPYKTLVLSWSPSLSDQLELVERFPGCREEVLFNRYFPCKRGTGAFLMRYIGADPLYWKGEELRRQGKTEQALKLHEQFLEKHPQSMAGHFAVGIETFQLGMWDRSQRAYAYLEDYFPEHLSILYNHALTLRELGEMAPAIERLQFVAQRDATNYNVMINLYHAYMQAGNPGSARDILLKMKKIFPDNREVDRLMASD